MKKILLIVIFFLINSQTFGGPQPPNWIEVLYNDYGKGFVDMNNTSMKNQIVNFDLLINFKKSILEKENSKHKSSIGSYEGDCTNFKSKLNKVIFFKEQNGNGKIVKSYGKNHLLTHRKGDSIERIIKDVCNSCENLSNTFFELSGVKLNESECNLLYFYMQVEILEKNNSN